MNLLAELRKLKGKTLQTLDRKSPFEIIEVTGDGVQICTSTGNERLVPWRSLEQAYAHLEKHGRLTRKQIGELGYSEYNRAYVAALLANLPGITFKIKPITLQF